MKKIPLKNYVILFVIVLITIIFTMYLSSFYKEKNKTESILSDYISEIKEQELTDYIIEKPIIFMYISDKYNLSNNNFEQELKNKINKENLKDYFVYLNVTELTQEFKDFFKENYKLDIDLNKNPILITIYDGNVESIKYIDIYNYNVDELIKSEVIK